MEKKNTITLIGRDRKRENVDRNLFKRAVTLKVDKGFAALRFFCLFFVFLQNYF